MRPFARRLLPAVPLLLLAVPLLPRPLLAGPTAEILALTGGKRVKIVWQRDTTTASSNSLGGADVFKLVGYDTNDDTVRVIKSTLDDYTKPMITRDGERIVYSDRREKKTYVVNWDGSGRQLLANGFAGALWYDAASGKEWVYFQRDGDGSNANLPIKRLNLDDPSEQLLVWNQSQTNATWLSISSDGERLGGSWPWNKCGVVVPGYGGSGGGDAYLSSNGYYSSGCWTTMTNDETHRFAVFDGAHRNWKVYDTPHGGNPDRVVNLNNAPGINGWEIYHPKLSNHPRFLTMNGPYSVGAMGDNNIPSGGRQVRAYFGKLDAGFTRVVQWIKVPDTADKASFYPSAWVEPEDLEPPPPVDTVAPTVEITAPADGALVSALLTVSGSAADNVALAAIEVQIDGGAFESASGAASWTFDLDTTQLADGPHSITARATDTAGLQASAAVQVNVDNAIVDLQPPQVNISSPLDGATVGGAITMTGTASDDMALGRVEVQVDDGSWQEASGSSSWSLPIDTQQLVSGPHTLTARAVDSSGNSASASVAVVVDNQPSISILSPAGGERWPAGSTQLIRWSTENLDNVMILYSTDGGATFASVAQTVFESDPEWGSFPWQVPAIATDQALIRIMGYFGEVPTNSELFTIESGASGPSTVDVRQLSFSARVPDPLRAGGVFTVAGEAVPIADDGSFAALIDVPLGASAVSVELVGQSGDVEVRRILRLEIGPPTLIDDGSGAATWSSGVPRDQQTATVQQFVVLSVSLSGTTPAAARVEVGALTDQDGIDDGLWQVGLELDGGGASNSLPADSGADVSRVLTLRARRVDDGETVERALGLGFYATSAEAADGPAPVTTSSLELGRGLACSARGMSPGSFWALGALLVLGLFRRRRR